MTGGGRTPGGRYRDKTELDMAGEWWEGFLKHRE